MERNRAWVRGTAGGLCLLLFLVIGAGATPDPQMQEYVGTAWILPTCHAAWPSGIGGVCFERPPATAHVSLLIVDDSGLETAGFVVFRNAEGPLHSEQFCLSYQRVIPTGTTHIQVNVNDAALGFALGCGITAGTSGRIVAVYR